MSALDRILERPTITALKSPGKEKETNDDEHKCEINNRDYLLIKGSNGTGLNTFIESMKRKISYVI